MQEENLPADVVACIEAQGCLTRSHLFSLMYDTNTLPECNPTRNDWIMFGRAVSLETAKPLLLKIAELEFRLNGLCK